MTIPDGVHIKGSDLRTTTIVPTGGTNNNNCFVLNGDVTISDVTIKDMFYDSVNDEGMPSYVLTTGTRNVPHISIVSLS